MKGLLVRSRQERRSYATSLAISALVHAVVLVAAVSVAPHTAGRVAERAELADAPEDMEIVTLVWPTEPSQPRPETPAPVERVVESNQRDLDDGVGDLAIGDIAGATATGSPAATDAPLSPDAPAAQGFGDIAAELATQARQPAAPTGLEVDKAIELPDVPLLVADGAPDANGNAKDEKEKEEKDGDGGGLGSILNGIGNVLDGIKVSVGGAGGGGMGGGGLGGGGKGGCVPGVKGIIGERGGHTGTVMIPQGPGIRTGIGGGRSGPMRPHRTTPC